MNCETGKSFLDANFWGMIVVAGLVLGLMCVKTFGAEVKEIRLSDLNVARVTISTRGTVLSFPTKPTKVILGKSGSFGIEYVENDLAISPLSLNSRSFLFVYLLGRRFTFDLLTSSVSGEAIVVIQDVVREKTEAKKK